MLKGARSEHVIIMLGLNTQKMQVVPFTGVVMVFHQHLSNTFSSPSHEVPQSAGSLFIDEDQKKATSATMPAFLMARHHRRGQNDNAQGRVLSRLSSVDL